MICTISVSSDELVRILSTQLLGHVVPMILVDVAKLFFGFTQDHVLVIGAERDKKMKNIDLASNYRIRMSSNAKLGTPNWIPFGLSSNRVANNFFFHPVSKKVLPSSPPQHVIHLSILKPRFARLLLSWLRPTKVDIGKEILQENTPPQGGDPKRDI